MCLPAAGQFIDQGVLWLSFATGGEEGLHGEIQVWTRTQSVEIYDQATSQDSEPGPVHKSPRQQLGEKSAGEKKSINRHTRTGREKVEGNREIKIYAEFGMDSMEGVDIFQSECLAV